MKSEITIYTVNGNEYKVWADYIKRGMYAEDMNGVVKCIKSSGYMRNELTIRKAIALMFNLTTFRKGTK